MLENELLPHTVRDHAGSVVEKTAQYVTAAANREKQASMLQTVEELLQKNTAEACVVHSMKFDGKQVGLVWVRCLCVCLGMPGSGGMGGGD